MSGIASLIPLVLLFVVFYFLLIRPQQKRMAQHAQLVRRLDVGDEIVTSAGIFGTITRLDDERIEVEVSGGARMELLKSAVARRVDAEPEELEEAVEEAAEEEGDESLE